MQNWQDLMEYVNNETYSAGGSFVADSLPSVNYWLNLANEGFKRLGALDEITFTPTGMENTTQILRPISCDVITDIYFKDQRLIKADEDNYKRVSDLAYCLSENRIRFNKVISYTTGDIILYGSGTFPNMVKDTAALNTPFNILNERFHETIAHYMLYRYHMSKPTRENQALAESYKAMFDDGRLHYIWAVRKAKSEYAKFFDMHEAPHRPFSVTTLTYNYVADIDAYTKGQTDVLLAQTLSAANAHADTEADRAQTQAQSYTNTMVGEINTVLDAVNGEDA